MTRVWRHMWPRPVRGWSVWEFHPLRLQVGGEKRSLNRQRLFVAFAVLAGGLLVTLVPEQADSTVLGDLSNGSGGPYVPTLCFLIGDLCLATGAWAAVAAARNRPLERPAVAALAIVSAALVGHCLRQVWQVLLLRDFYRPSLAFTSTARAAAVGWGLLLAVILTAGFLVPLLVAVANLLPRMLVSALAPTRWLVGCRGCLLLPFGALAATTIITQWVLPMPLATAMGFIDPAGSTSTTVSLRVLGTGAWTSLQILMALPLLLLMWDGTEAARSSQRLVRTPKGGQTALLTRFQRVDYRVAGAVTVCGVTAFVIAEGAGLGALGGVGMLLVAALSLDGSLGRVARLSKNFERGVRRWQLPEEWRDVGRVSLLIAVMALPVLLLVSGDVVAGLKNGLWLPSDLSDFSTYWVDTPVIDIPSVTAGEIFGHVETVTWITCLALAAFFFFGMLWQWFDEGAKAAKSIIPIIWLAIRISLFAVALAPVMHMADHPYAMFVLAGCAVLVSMLTSGAAERPAAVWSAIIIGGSLTLYSLLIWNTSSVPAAAVLCLTLLQRFVYNAGELNEPGLYRANRVAYYQAIPLLSVGMLALGHGAADGYFDSEDVATVSDHVALSVVAAIWLVMLIVRQTPRPTARGSRSGEGHESTADSESEAEPPDSWAWLLEPHRQIVRFEGREHELMALLTWCDNDHADFLRLVTGPGGVGKTRLAVELTEKLLSRKWHVTWVSPGDEMAVVTAALYAPDGRQLLVVDEAEARTGLEAMLTTLAQVEDTTVRVLLLARSRGAWLDLLSTGSSAMRNQLWLALQAQLSLPTAVTTAKPDHTLVAHAVGSLSKRFRLHEPRVETRYKKTDKRQLILDLQAAALVATLTDASLVETGTGIVQAEVVSTGLAQLLAHEQHFWSDSAREAGLSAAEDANGLRLLRQLIAVCCLLGPATVAEALALAPKVPRFTPHGQLAQWLETVSAASQGRPGEARFIALTRLAERHTLSELRTDPAFAQACTASLTRSQALHAVTFLARAVVDFSEATDLLLDILPGIADRISDPDPLADTLTAVLNALPYPCPALAPTTIELIRQLLDHLPAAEQLGQRAFWQAQLALRLAEIDDLVGSAAAGLEAAVIHAELAAVDPGRYLPLLAASLEDLGAQLAALGNFRSAELTAARATEIYRGLATGHPTLYAFPLALSLDDLTRRHLESSDPAAALNVRNEAVSVYRRLVAASQSPFRVGLAGALSGVAFRYEEGGQPARAVSAGEESVALYRELAGTDSVRYRPRLATELDNLGVYLSHAGRDAEAITATKEAIAIYLDLSKENSEAYRAALNRAWSNLRARQSRRPDGTHHDVQTDRKGHVDQSSSQPITRGRPESVPSLPSTAQEPQEAEAALRRKARRGSGAAKAALGELLLMQEGREAEAEELLLDAWLTDGKETARDLVCDRFRRAQRWTELERACRESINRGHRNDMIELGIALLNQDGRQAECEEVFRSAVAKRIRTGVALVNLGRMVGGAGRVDEAVDLLEKAARLGYKEVAALDIAKFLADSPRDSEADAWYRVAIAEGNASAPAYLARRQWARGVLNELDELYRLAIERGHGPAPYVEMACLLRMREPHSDAKAQELLTEALRQQIRWPVLDSVVRQKVVDRDAAIWVLTTSVNVIHELPESNTCTSAGFFRSVVTLAAQMLKDAGRAAETVDLYRDAVAGGRTDYLARLAVAVKAHGNASEAKQLFLRCLAEDVETVTALMNLGFLAENAGAMPEATQWYERAIARGENKVAYTCLALMLDGGPRDHEVPELYRLAIQSGERTAAVLLARRQWAAGELDGIEDLYARAIEWGREDVELERACVLHELGPAREAMAVESVRRALERGTTYEDVKYATRHKFIAPSTRIWLLQQVSAVGATFSSGHPSADAGFLARLLVLLGVLLGKADDADAARDALETAVRLGDVQANAYLGEMAEAAGDNNEAIRRYEAASQGGANWPLMNLARLHERMNQPDEMTAVVKRLLARIQPDEIGATGDEMHDQGDTSIALLFLREGRATGGGPAEAALARVIVSTAGQTEEAFELLHSALDQGDGSAAVTLGHLYAADGHSSKAEAIYRRGIDLGNENCGYHLGALLVHHGRLDEGADLLKRASAHGVTQASEALDELHYLRGTTNSHTPGERAEL